MTSDRSGSPAPPLHDRIVALLQMVEGASLSLEAVAHILDEDRASLSDEMSILSMKGRLARKREHRYAGWASIDSDPVAGSYPLETWRERLVEYVLASPGATVSELVAAAGHVIGNDGLKATLLHQAVRSARESGEFRIVTSLVEDLMSLLGRGLTDVQIRDIVSIVEPRKFRDLNGAVVRRFVDAAMKTLVTPEDRVMGLTRLAETEIMANHLPKGILLLNEALDICIQNETGKWIPAIIGNLTDATTDDDRMSVTADRIQKVIAWTPVLEDEEFKLRILATAAASLARIRRYKAADTTIQSAIALSSQVSPDTRRVLEWCRARVHIAAGRLTEAVNYLERALLLAENLNDQASISEILDTLVSTMKSQPGYTVRSLTAIMERVGKRATTSGNISNQIYAGSHLTDMYLRTLLFSRVQQGYDEIQSLVSSVDFRIGEPVAEWCRSFQLYLVGMAAEPGEHEVLIPGSGGFMWKMHNGEDPSAEAEQIADYFRTDTRNSTYAYGLYLALEAFAGGFRTAAAIIGAALQGSMSAPESEKVPSWQLCVSGLLGEEDGDIEDFFSSAQVLARQMDRLLLVWLLLRCRNTLDIDRAAGEGEGLSLLLMELDEYICQELTGTERTSFDSIRRVRDLKREMERVSGRTSSVDIIRDSLSLRMVMDPDALLDKIAGVSSRFSSRSEISWSLEAMGFITRSSRIQALEVSGGELRIIESYGLGRKRLPGKESAEAILNLPEKAVTVDNFGVSPFGSRRFIVIPAEADSSGTRREKRQTEFSSDHVNYILLEMESPFDTTRNTEFLISVFVRQIGSALLLRRREVQSYYDTMTGAAIRSSWMKKLNSQVAKDAHPSSPLSVLLVDVDRFKLVNDTFGHREGDRILKSVVSAISRALRPNDTIGRIGGDEFGIILPYASSENAEMIANRICDKVYSTVFRKDQQPVSVSIGVATVDSSESATNLVVSRADAALYQSKLSGRNRSTVWTTASDAVFEGKKHISLLDTGDPGWDHLLGQTVLEMISMPAEDITIGFLADQLRDLLRCEYLHIESASGEKASAGPQFAGRVRTQISRVYPDRIGEHRSVLDKYYVLSSMLRHGGLQIAAWDEADLLPGTIKGVFGALANLSDMLMDGR